MFDVQAKIFSKFCRNTVWKGRGRGGEDIGKMFCGGMQFNCHGFFSFS